MAEKQPTAAGLRALPDADIKAQREQLQKELWHLRLKAKEGSLQQLHQLRTMRRQVARINTVLKERR